VDNEAVGAQPSEAQQIVPDPLWIRTVDVLNRCLGAEPDLIRPNTSLVQELGADSLALTQLLADLEEEFEITIPEEDEEELISVSITAGGIYQYIREHVPQQ
jgi:acyl carrier protein